MVFQLMFAIITAALITGSIAERRRFPAFPGFILLWTTFVYDPLVKRINVIPFSLDS
jgi:Amt family ammonium transporter